MAKTSTGHHGTPPQGRRSPQEPMSAASAGAYAAANPATMSPPRKKIQDRLSTRVRQDVRSTLQLLQVGLCTATVVIIAAIAFSNSTAGKIRPDRFQLLPEDIPSGQDLALTLRRGKTGSNCTGFGLAEDEYFSKYGGVYCGQVVYEAPVYNGNAVDQVPAAGPPGPFNFEQPGDKWAPLLLAGKQLQKVETVYKTFDTVENANEYTWRFWGMHCQEPIPMYAMVEMTANAPLDGDQAHVLYWDPARMAWPLQTPVPEIAFAKHFLCVYRVGRTFVYVHLTGQSRNFALGITPEFVTGMANRVSRRVAEHSPGPIASRLRTASVAIRRQVSRLDRMTWKRAWGAWSSGTAWVRSLPGGVSAWVRSLPSGASAWVHAFASDVAERTKAPARPGKGAQPPTPATPASPTVHTDAGAGTDADAGTGNHRSVQHESPTIVATKWAPISADGGGSGGGGSLDIVGEGSTNGSEDVAGGGGNGDYLGEDDFVEVMREDFLADGPGAWTPDDLWGMLPMGGVLFAALAMSWLATANEAA